MAASRLLGTTVFKKLVQFYCKKKKRKNKKTPTLTPTTTTKNDAAEDHNTLSGQSPSG